MANTILGYPLVTTTAVHKLKRDDIKFGDLSDFATVPVDISQFDNFNIKSEWQCKCRHVNHTPLGHEIKDGKLFAIYPDKISCEKCGVPVSDG